METQDPVANRPDNAGNYDRNERERDYIGIIGEHIHHPVDLAALLPIGAGDELHRRAGIEQRRGGEERQAAGDKIDNPGQPRIGPPLPQPKHLKREYSDSVNAKRREMTEEQRDHTRGRQYESYRPDALANRDPAGERPQ